MKRIMAYLKPYTMTITGILFLKLFAALMDLLIPSILEVIIDQIIPTGSVPRIFLWGGVMIVCSVLAIVTNVSANRRTSIMSGNVTGVIRHDLFEKVSYLAPSQIDDFTTSSLISRLTSDTYNINQFISRMLRLGVRSPILLLGGIIITLTLDPVLTLVLLAMLPPIIIITYFVTKKSIPMYTHVQETLDKLVRTVQENITGIRVIKALSKSEYERQRFDGVNTGLSDEEQNVSLVTAVSKPANTLILNVGLTLVVLAGAFRVNSGLTQPGKIIAFLSYFSTILNALLGITRIFTIATKGIASGNRVSQVMDSNELLLPEEKEERVGDDYIVFDHVSFSYNKVENNISDLSFTLKKGDTLGIIGSTGSGKSTVLNLLMRFYDPDTGAIYIGGKDIRSIPHSKLARLFGVAFQNDFLMADSIRENVDYGRGLTDEQLDKALRCAQAESFVSQVEGGKDYELAVRGNNISGGQKQRLLIARALAAEPDILILDDSSSALDYKTDAQLRKALHTDFADTTSVIVAQRVSSILHSNLILVLDDGHVIGSGTHEELMKTCDTYRHIAETQMGGGADNA